MYADRNDRAKPNPVSLTAAIGINAALVAVLLLSTPDLPEGVETPLGSFFVSETIVPPPPPPEPQPQPERTTKVKRGIRIETPVPPAPVPLPPTNPVAGTVDPPPTIPADPGPATTGSDGPPVTVDPPKPAPVMTGAEPVRGVTFQPEYPPSERRIGTEGAVTVRVLIGTDGRVKAVELVRTASDAFFEATRRYALSRWRFKPATRDGVPYDSWRTMTVRFVLEE